MHSSYDPMVEQTAPAKNVRLTEVYWSVQGEGPRVGVPTTFVRFAGCNLRCPLWPCDTPYAIDPEAYRAVWISTSSDELIRRVTAHDTFRWTPNICLTGGEPFLQNHDALAHFVQTMTNDFYKTVDIFTNGTVAFPDWSQHHAITKIVDIKLEGSGEDPRKFVGFQKNLRHWDANNVAKFTVSSFPDFEEAVDFYEGPLKASVKGTARDNPVVYCGPVWGKIDPQEVVEWIADYKLPWRLNLQTHKYIWDPNERGI